MYSIQKASKTTRPNNSLEEVMIKKTIKIILSLSILASLSLLVIAWSFQKKAVVYSEPLSCFVQAEKTVCFDKHAGSNYHCEKVDAQTMLCNGSD